MAQPTVARYKRASLLVKTESSYGVDVTPGSSDVIQIRNCVYRISQGQFRDERHSGHVWDLPNIPGARWASISGEAVIRGAGAAYAAGVKPEIDALLRACGWAAALTATGGSEKWTYTPQNGTTMGESVTAKLIPENAPAGVILGAFGTGRISLRAGEPGIFAFTLSGLYVAPADVALVTGTPSTVQPPVFKSGAVTVNSVVNKVSSFEIDLGNEIHAVPSANDAQAVASFFIGWRQLMATLDPEQVTVAVQNWHNLRDLGTLVAASWQLGTVQYNRTIFTAPKLQVVDLSDFVRNGQRAWNATVKFNPSVGGDELTIDFT